MTDERKIALHNEFVCWVFEHTCELTGNYLEYAIALNRIGFTEEEIINELDVELCLEEEEIQAIMKELKGE